MSTDKNTEGRLSLGIAGSGMIAKEVIPGLRNWGWEPEVLCGTARSAETLEKICTEQSIPVVYTDYDRMLERAAIDTVYIAVPNDLHYEFARKALLAGKNVIVEKPMVSNANEAMALKHIALESGLLLFEAVSTVYLPIYRKTKELLPKVGDVRLVSCNFSQYSSRIDAFRQGEKVPVFDRTRSGGALMDLNVYNLHWLTGLFGVPKDVTYAANFEGGVDTNGILTLDYGSFKAVSIAAKDCGAPCRYVIQGTKGYLEMLSPANQCRNIRLHLNDGTEEYHEDSSESRLEAEFRSFADIIRRNERDTWLALIEDSLRVSRTLTLARMDAGIHFPADDMTIEL
ncbi:MAG: Gfo/Idh/MocA family oxidoreductase [Oscillospiraceae bacterium]|nr:Gfo/Idh/MocA family oxidoreductase [Oscillospiraceae bacterium]